VAAEIARAVFGPPNSTRLPLANGCASAFASFSPLSVQHWWESGWVGEMQQELLVLLVLMLLMLLLAALLIFALVLLVLVLLVLLLLLLLLLELVLLLFLLLLVLQVTLRVAAVEKLVLVAH
jgi:hypothetical protein